MQIRAAKKAYVSSDPGERFTTGQHSQAQTQAIQRAWRRQRSRSDADALHAKGALQNADEVESGNPSSSCIAQEGPAQEGRGGRCSEGFAEVC